MHSYRKLTDDLYWVGGNDRRLALFENIFPLPRGVSYNAYFVDDEKTLVMDTVDRAVAEDYFQSLNTLLRGRPLDYVVVHHMEPDHAATLSDLLQRWPAVKIICTARAEQMIGQFFDFDTAGRVQVVGEGDTLETGRHRFHFYMAPMVHWPEVMVSYDTTDGTLFSADAFGSFGALGGSIFAEELPFETEWLPDARRYYTNIVGKYGRQVQALLKKTAELDIRLLCPLHGPVWRENLGWYVDKYRHWAAWEPEERAVLVAYGSAYGHTANAAALVAARLVERGVKNVAVYDVSGTHPSVLVAEAFRCSHLVLAAPTYNADIYPPMATVLHEWAAHGLRGRTVALIENGSWAPAAAKHMRAQLDAMPDMTVLCDAVTLLSAVKEDTHAALLALADSLASDLCS